MESPNYKDTKIYDLLDPCPGDFLTSSLTCPGAGALFKSPEKVSHGARGLPESHQIGVRRPLAAKTHFFDTIFSDFERNFI